MPVPSIDPAEAARRMTSEPGDFVLLDCREHEELELASVPGALHLPMGEIPARLATLDPKRAYGVLCHHGVRSAQVAAFLLARGFSRVQNVRGGIAAWARLVDPGVGTY